MSHVTVPDISVTIEVPGATASAPPLVRTERRITPSWSIGQLKTKLEPITGIPPASQVLSTFDTLSSTPIPLSTDTSLLSDPVFCLRRGSTILVTDTRPPSLRTNFSDVSAVEKYEMPVSQYERLDDTVLAWKKRQRLGRFDPHAKSPEELERDRREGDEALVASRGIEAGRRCKLGDERRGTVRYVGEIEGLGGAKERGCVWVGVELDEPLGRNDGSVTVENEGKAEVKRVFTCERNFGVFARPEKVEVGEFPVLDDLDEDMEEI